MRSLLSGLMVFMMPVPQTYHELRCLRLYLQMLEQHEYLRLYTAYCRLAKLIIPKEPTHGCEGNAD